MTLGDKLEKIKEKVSLIQEKVGIENSVEIVAVTKTHPFQIIKDSYNAGFFSIGENRVQEAISKFQSFESMPKLNKRFIGHLQSNKVKKCINIFDTIDSVDSLKLLKKIAKEAKSKEKEIPVLLEVNTSKEPQKKGFSSVELDSILSCFYVKNVKIEGLMTMAPFTDEKKVIRKAFIELRRLKEKINNQTNNNKVVELSMGMSNDYEIAVEEGSTMIRLGTSLFGQRGPLK